jgi:hypothetical protein
MRLPPVSRTGVLRRTKLTLSEIAGKYEDTVNGQATDPDKNGDAAARLLIEDGPPCNASQVYAQSFLFSSPPGPRWDSLED